MMNMNEKIMHVEELQNELGIGRDTAYALMRNHSFPSIKIGRRYIVERKAFEEWLARSRYKTILI